MKKTVSSPSRTIFAAFILLLSAACANTGDSSAIKRETGVEQGPALSMAEDVSVDAGRVAVASGARGDRTVIAFEEAHDSRLGQVEIALMLLKLHNKYGMSRISLEGAIAEEGPLPTEWFHALASSEDTRQSGVEVPVHLLKTGEISAAEFIALTVPRVTVIGNEREDQYQVELADGAPSATIAYLLAIAQESLSPSQIREANRLIGSGEEEEAVEFIFGSDPWIKEQHQELSRNAAILSTEEMTELLQQIGNRAKKVGARISQEDRSNFGNLLRFFEVATQRHITMTQNTLTLASQVPSAPVGMIIGAAHTRGVAKLLENSKISFAVISPNSLADATDKDKLDRPAYQRKLDKQSVDPSGSLGAILDGRRKPPVVLGEQWFQSKSSIWLATDLIAAAAADGEKAPFSSLESELKKFRSIWIDPTSFKVIEKDDQNRVLFKVTARTDNEDPNRKVDFWVGTWSEPPGPPTDPDTGETSPDEDPERRNSVSLEDLVEKTLREMKNEKSTPEAYVAILPITERTKATFSESQVAVRETMEAG